VAVEPAGGDHSVDIPSADDEGVFARDNGVADHGLTLGNHAPAHGPESFVEAAPVFDLGEVDDAVRLDLNVLFVDGLHEHLELLLRHRLGRNAVEAVRPVDDRHADRFLGSHVAGRGVGYRLGLVEYVGG